MARHEIWIIADNDSADKMLKLHQLKNVAPSDADISQWYLFSAFDIFTQTAKAVGNCFQQLERGLLKTMQERPRVPHSIIFILGDSLLEDAELCWNPNNLAMVLHSMFKQLKRQMYNFIDMLPQKARPITEVQFFTTKALPKPEKFYRNRIKTFYNMARARHAYNDKLVKSLRELGMNFINPGISANEPHLFTRITLTLKKEKFKLNENGLHAYWQSISSTLYNLHKGHIKTTKSSRQGTPTFQQTPQLATDQQSARKQDDEIEQYFTGNFNLC